MNEILINVKAKEKGAAGYSFKVNEVQPIQPEIVYLNENKLVKKFENFPMEIFIPVFIPKFFQVATEVFTPLLPVKAIATMGTVNAAVNHIDIMPKLMPLIHILQDVALPVAIIVASWGCIEWIIGSPHFKHKIKTSVIGYTAIFGIPFIFTTLRDVLSSLS